MNQYKKLLESGKAQLSTMNLMGTKYHTIISHEFCGDDVRDLTISQFNILSDFVKNLK